MKMWIPAVTSGSMEPCRIRPSIRHLRKSNCTLEQLLGKPHHQTPPKSASRTRSPFGTAGMIAGGKGCFRQLSVNTHYKRGRLPVLSFLMRTEHCLRLAEYSPTTICLGWNDRGKTPGPTGFVGASEGGPKACPSEARCSTFLAGCSRDETTFGRYREQFSHGRSR